MRRLLAMAMLVLLGLPFAAPLLAQRAADRALPMCCRKEGKHHCMAKGMADGSVRQVRARAERCPYGPAVAAVFPHTDAAGLTSAATVFGEWTSHFAVMPQVAARARRARGRGRGTRGPPPVLSL